MICVDYGFALRHLDTRNRESTGQEKGGLKMTILTVLG